MEKRKKVRLISFLVLFFSCASGVYFILLGLSDNIVFFFPPSEIYKIKNLNKKIRIGGLVKEGTVVEVKTDEIKFYLTDNKKEILVNYKGILPALFREKQGIVAEGYLVLTKKNVKIFRAVKLLTKHDENYKPPGDKMTNKINY